MRLSQVYLKELELRRIPVFTRPMTMDCGISKTS